MTIQNCPKNIRCDTATCNNFASYNINTSGYKGNISLCQKCFDDLYECIKQMKKQITKLKEKNK